MTNHSRFLTFLVGFGLLSAPFLFSSAAFASTYDFPLKNMKGNARVLVSVPDAQVMITGAPTASSLKITLLDAAQEEMSVQTRQDQIEVVAKEGAKEKWGPQSGAKKRVIEISGATVPVEVHLFDGSVTLLKWDKDALVQIQKGKLSAKGNGGHLTAHVQKGDISIQDHNGKINVDSYAAKVSIQELNGDLNLENFSGESQIEKVKGYLSLSLGSGLTKVSASQGTLQFENNKGVFTSQAFNGRIEGKTQEGPVTVLMANEGEVNIKSQAGKVVIKAIAGQGTLLSLVSTEGDIYLPSYLKVNRDSSGKSFRGRLRGEGQKGSVVVRSQSGPITVTEGHR
jgi:hypothetical protein